MPLVKGETVDGMKEACTRLDISRATMLRYFKDGTLSEPPRKRQGKVKVRIFTEEWYEENEPKLAE